MFLDLFESICSAKDNLVLCEVLTKTEIDKMKGELATPEILPCAFDVTIQGWLERIGHWGQIKILHKNPEKWRGKRKVTIQRFIKGLEPDAITKYFGKWEFVKKGLTKVQCHRTYLGVDGKKYVEKFFVSVKLRKELR